MPDHWFAKVFTVALRDFRHTVLTKAFILGVIGVPILIAGVLAITVVMLVGHKEPPLIGTIAVVADEAVVEAVEGEFAELAETGAGIELVPPGGAMTPGMPEAMGAELPVGRGEVRVEIEPSAAGPDGIPDAIRTRVLDGDLLAAVFVSEDSLAADAESGDDRPRVRVLVADGVDSDHVSLIERRFGRAVISVRADRAGLDPERARTIMRSPRMSTERVVRGETRKEDANLRELRTQVIPMVFMMLMWGAAFGTANQLLTSTIEEKSNRIMEVLLSAISPLQLMSGKILGQCAAGLVIVTVYSSLGLSGLIVASQVDLVTPAQLIYLGIYFFMAYFMVASVMAAVGSAVSDLREANSLVTPVMILLTVPLMLWFPISLAPNGIVATTFSFIPPAIPFVMILRLCAEEPVPAWQIALSIVWGYGATVGMIWMASRIFRVGVLMSGKPPSPLELLRWVRYR